MTDPRIRQLLAQVPAVRGDEPGGDVVPSPRATRRDLRWYRNTGRGTAAAGALVLILLVASYGAPDAVEFRLAAAAVLLWWITGLAGIGRHSTRMGHNMARACDWGMVVWRHLPEPDRENARPVAEGLLKLGAAHDVAGVRVRLTALEQAARHAQARHLPGTNDDVDQLTAWMNGADETHPED